MKLFFAARMFLFLLDSYAQTPNKTVTIPLGSKQNKTSKEAVPYFAEGCFWYSEIFFQSLNGVRDAGSGYAGGTSKNPTYESVSTGETGHTERLQFIMIRQK